MRLLWLHSNRNSLDDFDTLARISRSESLPRRADRSTHGRAHHIHEGCRKDIAA